MSLEDRQESFFLSETVKYLYLLFDLDNPINRKSNEYIFTTEGHILPLSERFHDSASDEEDLFDFQSLKPNFPGSTNATSNPEPVCDTISLETRYSLPLRSQYLQQIFAAFGLTS